MPGQRNSQPTPTSSVTSTIPTPLTPIPTPLRLDFKHVTKVVSFNRVKPASALVDVKNTLHMVVILIPLDCFQVSAPGNANSFCC